MKKRNCKKIVKGYFNRYIDKKPGEKVYATPKEIKAYEGLCKYKPNCWLLYIVHENLNCNNLCVWVGG